jgi:hypothetical protein
LKPCRLIVLLLAAAASSVDAHHSINFDFDTERTVTIEGVVTEVWWNNPHVRIYLGVADEDGSQAIWDTHSASPNLLRRGGWNQDTIRAGDRIVMSGNPGRDGAKMLFIQTVTLEDGTVLNRFGYMRN